MASLLYVSALAFFGARRLSVHLHEQVHALVARLLGCQQVSVQSSSTTVEGLAPAHAPVVRHAGWVFSMSLAMLLTTWSTCWWSVIAGAWYAALDACASDLLLQQPAETEGGSSSHTFYCGNFGLMLLSVASSPRAKALLEKMLRVTMMRGAQSAGLVTYTPEGRAIRCRVVNGKRTDLCELLMRKCQPLLQQRALRAPQLFQGHTRFATTSIAALPGCHPHQWCPPAPLMIWEQQPNAAAEGTKWVSRVTNVEGYITHNGDLDFYSIHGIMYPLEELQILLAAVLHAPMPATVDSACVAGLLDVLRAKGSWRAAVRYGYLYGALATSGNLTQQIELLWSLDTLIKATAAFEREWQLLVDELSGCAGVGLASADAGGATNGEMSRTTRHASRSVMRALMEARMLAKAEDLGAAALLVGALSASNASALISRAVGAFFDQDLLAASRQLLAHAVGSFGLVLSTSLDAEHELVVASRGQTMSVAFYPLLGAFLFGSEAAATKAGLGEHGEQVADRASRAPAKVAPSRVAPSDSKPAQLRLWDKVRSNFSQDDALREGFRFDLDDLNGEVLLLRWGDTSDGAPMVVDDPRGSFTQARPLQKAMEKVMQYDDGKRTLWATNYMEEKFGSRRRIMSRVLRLGGNPLVLPIPPLGGLDPVGADLADLATILWRIHADWNRPSESLNRLSAFTFQSRLRKRMLAHEEGRHDGSIDILVSGCEVSLWVGEQFAADLHRVFPKLRIVALSANKLLGQLGQASAVPQTGFPFQETSFDLSESIVLLLSHSGGTFATLNASNLLKGFTSSIFVITSEWDTQVARSVRAGKPGEHGTRTGHARWTLASYVFTTFCGCRPAEPCSVSVAATHQLLTQLLLYTMYATRYYVPNQPRLCGSSYCEEEVRELETLNRNTLDNLERLSTSHDSTRGALLAQAARWAQHVLEGPVAWALCTAYIVITVTSGYTPLSLVALGSQYALSGVWGWGSALGVDGYADPIKYVVGFLDALLYAFLPWWMTVLLRLKQRRPWHHRVAGRSLLIGDVPWVAQSLEAFVSKLFALSYSIASLHVASANPCDHLVHRHTHRVVRGALLAVGRPDGRLNALSTAETTACLAVNQASSIQNMGVTLESFTLGHNPYTLALSQAAVHLPTTRPPFFPEWLVGHRAKRGMSSGAMMGLLSALASEPSPSKKGARQAETRRPTQFQQIEPLPVTECVGEWMLHDDALASAPNHQLLERQVTVQALYEARFASLERFVGFLILFHSMARRVADWWRAVSFGLLGYDMSRSHSIMRIATTASPVSGSEVRVKMLQLAEDTRKLWAARTMQFFFRFTRRERGRWEVDRLKKEVKALRQVELMRMHKEAQEDASERRGQSVLSLVAAATDEAEALAAVAAMAPDLSSISSPPKDRVAHRGSLSNMLVSSDISFVKKRH